MKTEQLIKGTEISDKITQLKRRIASLNKADEGFYFKQFGNSDSFVLEISKSKGNELTEQLRTVFQATKQTIKSLIEREIDNLQKEFDSL